MIWIFTVLLICTTDDEVCRLQNMFCKIKYIVFKIEKWQWLSGSIRDIENLY